MIISRYLTKEVLNALLAVTFVLLLLFLSNQLVRYLNYAASGKIAANILLQLLGFEIPHLLAVLLPLGLYLGAILAYGRLYADSEMRVMHAYGLSIRRLVFITGMMAALVMVVVSVLVLWINPWIQGQKEKVMAQSGTNNVLDTLMPGRFRVSNDGKRVIYIENISRNRKQADNVFIADERKNPAPDSTNNLWTILSASAGYQTRAAETPGHFIVAVDGYRYEGSPGQNDYKIIQFKKYAVRMPEMTNTKRQEQEAIPTLQLFSAYHDPELAAELQWRLSIPLSALLLALLAIPLSQVKPRQGRYSVLFPAVLIYVVYVNLLFVARNLIEQKVLSVNVGMWWVHLLAFGLAMILLIQLRKSNA